MAGIADLKKFFSTEDRPVLNAEMQEFWKSLTEEEKEQFKAEIETVKE